MLDAKTGKPLMDRERLPGVRSFYSSPVAAAGRIYLASQDGTTLVLKEGDQPEVIATNKLERPDRRLAGAGGDAAVPAGPQAAVLH